MTNFNLYFSGGYVSQIKDVFCYESYWRYNLRDPESVIRMKKRPFNLHSFGNLSFEYNTLETCISLFKKWSTDGEKNSNGRYERSAKCTKYQPYILYDEISGSCGCAEIDARCSKILYQPIGFKMFKVFEGSYMTMISYEVIPNN